MFTLFLSNAFNDKNKENLKMPYVHIDPKYYALDKITIKRDYKDFPQTVSAENANGDTVFTCTQDWTDEQILLSIKHSAHAFKMGKMCGAGQAFDEMKNLALEKKQRLSI